MVVVDGNLDEILSPSKDPRRLDHLRRSDETFERYFDPEPIQDLEGRPATCDYCIGCTCDDNTGD